MLVHSDFINLKDLNVTPYTVFLTPPTFLAIENVAPVVTKTQSISLNTPISKRGLNGFEMINIPKNVRFGGMQMPISGSGQGNQVDKILAKKTVKIFQSHAPDFGANVKPIRFTDRMGGAGIEQKSVLGNDSMLNSAAGVWRPKGILAGQLLGHSGPIIDLVMAPDHSFFISGSSDGTVGIWDTRRLHTNVTNRSRLIYSGHSDSQITAVAFCEGKHSIVSASKSGKIHINRIEYIKTECSPIKYTGFGLVQEIDLGVNDSVKNIGHYDTDSESLLVYTTANGIFTAMDLRSMKPAWSFQSPSHYGDLSALALDSRKKWAVTGTHRGVVTLWDIRYQLCMKSWAHPSRCKISQLDPFSFLGRASTSISVSVDNAASEVSVWDSSTGICHEAWCVLDKDRKSVV